MHNSNVAPRAGAWIETPRVDEQLFCEQSLPVRERGLKLFSYFAEVLFNESLPVRERGLKLAISSSAEGAATVAPRAGAWIETFCDEHAATSSRSLPVRERGLKP